jgi:LmbE family N-acetylglucosaminyl deacetylase
METLTLFDDADLARVLAVVAHPDDMEYGGAAAVACWTARGVDVAYAVVTSGEAGIDSLPPEQARPLREREQREACARVGVSDLRFLGFPDGTLEYSLDLRRAIAAQIRRFRPDTVVTGGFRETWRGGWLNQADHIAVGRAVVDAVRDAGNRWVFPDLTDAGLEPWNGVRTVLAFGSPLARQAVEVTDGFAAGVASLEAHAEYLSGLGESAPVPAEMLGEMLGATGREVCVAHAVAVEVLHL